MEQRIEEQLEGHKPGEIYELNLDGCEATQITGLTDDFVSLETLTLTNNSLTSLKGLPSLPNLRKLDLSDNQLADGLELLQSCPNLDSLILSGNLFKDFASLEPLKKLQALRNVELYSCPVTDNDDYQTKIWELLGEHVIYIDGFDRQGHPAPNDDDDDGDEGDDGEEGGSEDEDDGGSEDGGEGNDEGDEDDGESDAEGDAAARGTKRKHDDDDEDA